MCMYSMVTTNQFERWPQRFPWVEPIVNPPQPNTWYVRPQPAPSREEFDALKAELEALRELLKAAKIYDESTGQPDCEDADKVQILRTLAELLGVDLGEAAK